MSALTPLWQGRDLQSPVAWRHGEPVSGTQFLADAQRLAGRLPPAARVVNLCGDRYAFSVALAAAWSRGDVCLLPPNAMPQTLAQVARPGESLVALVDDPDFVPPPGLAMELVDAPWPDAGPSTDMPSLGDEADAVCLMTSGSTGVPQPHTKAWGPLRANIAAEAQRLAECLGQADLSSLTVVASVPPQHSYGLESSVLLPLLGGAAFDSGRPFYPADIADALARVPRPRALVTTPFHLKTLLQSGVVLPPTDLVLSATAPLSPQLAEQAEAAFGGVLIEIYGCTEAGQVATRRTSQGDQWRAFAGLRLWREEGAEGERFLVQGGHVIEPTPLADVLELQDEQRFRLLGRSNDLIHVAGKRSSLAFLNFQLNRLPGVQDGCFWMPDEVVEGVVRPVAFVVAPELTAAQVIAGLRAVLEPAFVPRKVVHVDELPREATGKLTSGTLRAFALAQLARAKA
jgi:acyl-coenzyme A synthetase/AMP-(fatty) acid ligase